jgi:twitching motility protein PilT
LVSVGRDIEGCLAEVVRRAASDLHLIPDEPPVLRCHGEILRMEGHSLGAKPIGAFVESVLTPMQTAALNNGDECDCALHLPTFGRFRVNVFNHLRGRSVALRYIPEQVPTLAHLEVSSAVAQVATMERGLVLVTGPAGSGKSTTLAAIIDAINSNRSAHVITIEDPIEYVHVSRRSVVHQREVGTHTRSFAAALRSALREDPNIIMIGELRDMETIQLALTAAETGHLVLASLHSANAPMTIDRIIDVFPAAQQGQVRAILAESLRMVVAQTLCPRRSGGRIAAMEILVATPAVRTLIREGKNHQIRGVMETSCSVGMQTLAMHLRRLVSEDVVPSDFLAERFAESLR